jgi:hypothetical protein
LKTKFLFFPIIPALLFFLIFSLPIKISASSQQTVDQLLAQIEALNAQIAAMQNGQQGLADQYDAQIADLQKTIDELRAADVPPERPVVALTEPSVVNLIAGTSKDVEIVVKNLSADTAERVSTTITSLSDPAIFANFSTAVVTQRVLTPNNSLKIPMRITIPKETKTGFYSITLTHTYDSKDKKEFTSTSLVRLSVKNNEPEPGAPLAVLKNIALSSENISAGDNFSLEAELFNDSNAAAKAVQITVEGLSADSIYLAGSTNILDYAELLPSASRPLKIDFATSPKTKSGSYPIALNVKFSDEKGTEFSKSYSYYVGVNKSSGDAVNSQIIIESISAPAETIAVGREFTTALLIKNLGDSEVKNIKITAKPEGENAVVPKSTAILQIAALAAGQSASANFKFAPTASSKSQNYALGFTLEYETGKILDDDKKEIISFTQYQGVNVSNPDADKKDDEEKKISVPKIIVSDYSVDPLIVQAGREFDLSMTFKNTSSSKGVKNIKAFLTVPEGTEKKGNVFSPVQSSNTFFIDAIAPGATAVRSARMFAVPDASPRSYEVYVNFEYEDYENNPYEAKEIIGVNVKQITRLDVGSINFADAGDAGVPQYLTFQFYNTGKVTLSNVLVKLSGDGFDFAGYEETFYGTLNAGAQQYFEAEVVPTAAGLLKGAITISYEDDAGEALSETREFSMTAAEIPAAGEGLETGGLDMNGAPINAETASGNKNSNVPLVAGGIGAAVLGTAGLIFRRRLRIKKERALNE